MRKQCIPGLTFPPPKKNRPGNEASSSSVANLNLLVAGGLGWTADWSSASGRGLELLVDGWGCARGVAPGQPVHSHIPRQTFE